MDVHTSCVPVRWIGHPIPMSRKGWWTPLCQRFFSAYPSLHISFPRMSLATNRFGGLAEVQNVYINWPFNSREIDASNVNGTAKCYVYQFILMILH